MVPGIGTIWVLGGFRRPVLSEARGENEPCSELAASWFRSEKLSPAWMTCWHRRCRKVKIFGRAADP